MEGLLILVGIYVLEIVIKKVSANRKKKFEEQAEIPENEIEPAETDNAAPSQKPKRSLQDLIREFEEAQRNASQGTMEPAMPPLEPTDKTDSANGQDSEDTEDEEELPVVTPKTPGSFTFEEIAKSVVQWEYASVDLLEQAFGFSQGTAVQVLADLQEKRIVGRDMGDGYCDVLVHDQVELDNLFKREQREAAERQAASAEEASLRERREAEQKHQQELAELEERARKAREESGMAGTSPEISDSSETEERIQPRTFDKREIRRGFIWAKVIDEPRFKRHWSPKVR